MMITVIGGMNLDWLGVPDSTFLLRDSNPGRVIMRPGGVGRNIAAHLHRLGAGVRLITAIGNDVHARMLADACGQEGIDLSLSVPADQPCPVYLCIHDDKGDMAAAVSDMAAIACLTPEAVLSRIAEINASDACVLDANLPSDTLEAVAKSVSVPLIADPVSAAKAERLRPVLGRLKELVSYWRCEGRWERRWRAAKLAASLDEFLAATGAAQYLARRRK